MTSTPLPMGSASPPEVIERCFDSATEHFMNAVTESFALIDQEGRVVRANIAYRRLTGPAGGAHDASIISYIEPERREGVRETLRGLNEKMAARTLQLRFRIGHETRLIESELTWMGPEGLISFVGRDVTKQDLLERERQETAAARDAVEQVGDIGHWRAGRDFKLQCSNGAARILGLDPAAPPLVLTDLVEMILADDRPAAVAAAREAFEKRKPMRHTLRVRILRWSIVLGALALALGGAVFALMDRLGVRPGDPVDGLMLRRPLLEACACPVVNYHSGVNPAYRGINGGYFALANGEPENFGVTLHLVDLGVDTGPILATNRIETAANDNIQTYMTLMAAKSQDLVVDTMARVLAGDAKPLPKSPLPSAQYYAPTLGQYSEKTCSHLQTHSAVHRE